jgi:hypothetical protein
MDSGPRITSWKAVVLGSPATENRKTAVSRKAASVLGKAASRPVARAVRRTFFEAKERPLDFTATWLHLKGS